MKSILDYDDKQTFRLILNFLKAGGRIEVLGAKMQAFLKKYEIDTSKLEEYLGDKELDQVKNNLKQAGLL